MKRECQPLKVLARIGKKDSAIIYVIHPLLITVVSKLCSVVHIIDTIYFYIAPLIVFVWAVVAAEFLNAFLHYAIVLGIKNSGGTNIRANEVKKVLYLTFTCAPNSGSDEMVGWQWANEMSKYAEVYVITRMAEKNKVETYLNGIHNNLHFYYCTIPKVLNIYNYYKKDTPPGLVFLIYQYIWWHYAMRLAKEIIKENHIDLVHYITNDFRYLQNMKCMKFKKMPYIIGPVGGGQKIPDALEWYARNHGREENFRVMVNDIVTSKCSYRVALDGAMRVYVSNEETAEIIKRKTTYPNKVDLLCETGATTEMLNLSFGCKEHQEFIFLYMGKMEYRKGLEFLLDVLDVLPERNWKMYICGDGSLLGMCRKRAKESNYCSKLIFTGRLSYEKAQEYYGLCDAFVFPSIRETTGTVIIEAMSRSKPVIALKQGGAAYLINEKTGYPVTGQSREEYINNFAKAMIECIDNRKECYLKGQKAKEHIIEGYTWESKAKKMFQVYNEPAIER